MDVYHVELAKLQSVLWQTEVQDLLLTLPVLFSWLGLLKSVLLACFPTAVAAFRDSSYFSDSQLKHLDCFLQQEL